MFEKNVLRSDIKKINSDEFERIRFGQNEIL